MYNFIDELKAAEVKRKPVKKNNETPLDIFKDWWDSLRDEDRNRPYYTMGWFRYHIAESPAMIASVLHQAGWTKSRIWRVGAANTRIWLQPL